MKTKSDFIDFYQRGGKKILKDAYYKDKASYQKAIKKCIFYQLLILVIIIINILFFNRIFNEYIMFITLLTEIILFFLFLIINIRLIYKEKKKAIYLINEDIYLYVVSYFSPNDYICEPETELAVSEFNKMGLFNLNLLNYCGCNFTASSYLGKKFIYCDVTLYDLVERIKHDSYYDNVENIKYIINYHYQDQINIFNGLYYETEISHDNYNYIYLIPNNISDKFVKKNILHYISYKGYRIELENLQISQKYCVYSFDEIRSRYILSLTLMEKINELDKLLPNKKYLVFKKDGRVGIYIDNFSIEKLKMKSFNIHKEISLDYLLSWFNIVKKIFQISLLFDEKNKTSKDN